VIFGALLVIAVASVRFSRTALPAVEPRPYVTPPAAQLAFQPW